MSDSFNSRSKEIWEKKPKTEIGLLRERIIDGDVNALSEAITLIEGDLKHQQIKASQLLDSLPTVKSSVRIGVTGPPGVGKSTFIESVGVQFLEKSKKVAVLSIDPSSVKTKGAILGDKTRMFNLSRKENVFIRPSSNSAYLGGVKHSTFETVLLCEAAGYDLVIIETVGVGQSEIDISNLVDITVVVTLPNTGDSVQTLKKGVMEIADFILINKSDLISTQNSKNADQYSVIGKSQYNIPIKVLSISALKGEGIAVVAGDLLKFHHDNLKVILDGRASKAKEWIVKCIQHRLLQMFWFKEDNKSKVKALLEEVDLGERIPFQKINNLLY